VRTRADHAGRFPSRFRAYAGYLVANAAFAELLVTLILSAFHAPAPHEVPVGIVAPAAVTGQVEDALSRGGQDAFALRAYPSKGRARTAVTHQDIAGALVASGGSLRLLVAEAGGTGPAQALTRAFGAVAARTGHSLAVTDIAAPLPGDTGALSPFFVILGVLFPSLTAGSASALAFRRARPAWCVAAPVIVAAIVGVAAAGIADGISGLGNYAAIAGIAGLFSLAVSAPTAVLGRIWPPLVSVAVLVFMVLGLPASGGPASLGSFGPAFLRVLHPALPLGAAADAVRGAVYFHGFGTAAAVWVLTAWAAAGLIGLLLTVMLRRPHPAAGLARPPAPAGPAPSSSIVIGFDNSGPAQRALAWAARRAVAHPAVLRIIYADHVAIDSDLSGFAHDEMTAARDEDASAIEQAAADIVAGTGIRYTFERRQGPPADAILAEASARAALAPHSGGSIIVVGRSGRAAHHLLGSVPVRLLHRSPYPVLTIP